MQSVLHVTTVEADRFMPMVRFRLCYVSYRTTDLENWRTSVALRRKTLLDQRGSCRRIGF